MTYTQEQIDHIEQEYYKNLHGLQQLMMDTVVAGQSSSHERVREHLMHGVSRRIKVMEKSIRNIFQQFPLETVRPLSNEILSDVQINLHAFMINLYGIFDNWAWAFVFKHNLLQEIGDRKNVGLFNQIAKRYLPEPLKDYVSKDSIKNWHDSYLKSFRDALAHRIPLYIPPAEFTYEDGAKYNELEAKKMELIKSHDWGQLEELEKKQANIGNPSFCFLHSYNADEASIPILLHPQLLSDSASVVEFGNLFLEHWNNRAYPIIPTKLCC